MRNVVPIISNNNNYYLYFIKEKILTVSSHQINKEIELLNKENKNGQSIKFDSKNKYVINDFLNNDFFRPSCMLSGRITDEFLEQSLSSIKQIAFELTEDCNLNCYYCGYGNLYCDYDKREGRSLDSDYFINLLKFLQEKWNTVNNNSHNRRISLSFYGGEPLLEINTIKKIIEYANTLKLKHNFFDYAMTTNALLLKKNIKFLVENNFQLLISLDGNQNHNTYRTYKNGKSSFNRIFENIKFVKETYPKYFQTKVEFNSVLHNKNKPREIQDFFMSEFGKTPSISELSSRGVSKKHEKKFLEIFQKFKIEKDNNLNLDKSYNGISEVYLSRFLHNNLYFNKNNYLDLLYDNCTSNSTPTGTCLPMTKKIFVTAKGKILACERIGHENYLGFVTKNEVKFDFNKIKELYNSKFDKLSKLCSSCYNMNNCSKCIFHLDFTSIKLKCDEHTSYNDFKNQLVQIVNYFEQNPEKISEIQKNYEFIL